MSLSIEIDGLDDLLAEFQPGKGKATKRVAHSMSASMLELDTAIRGAVNSKFAYDKKLKLLHKSFKSSSTVLEGTLQYKFSYLDLSKFPTTWEMGNINAGARRQGRVHSTEVVRGRPKIIKGRSHHGGFLLLNKRGNPKRFGRHGTQMVERIGDSKLPLRLLLGPSTHTMVGWAFRKDPTVIGIVSKYGVEILESYL